MSLYRLHFTWKGKEVVLKARSLDMTHPYFVSIKDLILPENNPLIINPATDDLRKDFQETNHIMIPFQTVSLIEELSEEKSRSVKKFAIVEEEEENIDNDSR